MKAQDQIKAWLEDRGSKQSWLASRIPVTQANLSRWLNDHATPWPQHRAKLAEITGLDVQDRGAWE